MTRRSNGRHPIPRAWEALSALQRRCAPRRLAVAMLGFIVAACGSGTDHAVTSPNAAANGTSGQEIEYGPPTQMLTPLPGKDAQAPALTRAATVLLNTTAGELTVEIYPEAAPNAAERFIELVEAGYYDAMPISRVVPGFVAQFGVNWRPEHRGWKDRTFADDPTLFALERGTLAFAKAGPNTNSTQVFINYVENNRLADPQYNFTVFGQVVGGMDAADDFIQVGDPNGGLDQARLWNDGEAYLESLPRQPTMIERAVVR